jgi:hypothetical protein
MKSFEVTNCLDVAVSSIYALGQSSNTLLIGKIFPRQCEV